jgi:hypothetical protein
LFSCLERVLHPAHVVELVLEVPHLQPRDGSRDDAACGRQYFYSLSSGGVPNRIDRTTP